MCSTSLLDKILPTNLGACKPTFYTFYTLQLRRNSTVKRFFFYFLFFIFHIDLGKNAVFHNCAIQIVLIQYSGRSQYAWDFSDFTYTASRFSLLTSAQFAVRAVPLIELRFKIIKNSSCLFFI